MAVTVTCPACEQSATVSEDLLGKKIRCKSCQEVFAAAASPVRVGARGGNGAPAAAGRNGTHTAGPAAKPAPKSGGGKVAAFAGGGLALVAMAGVIGWALTRGDKAEPNKPQQTNTAAAPSVPKLQLNDVAPPTTPTTPAVAEKAEMPAAPANATVVATPVRQPRRPLMAGFAESPKSLPPAMPPEVVERIKKSAVMLRVMRGDGGGEGSGWFAEPGIVITNAHVVGMKESAMAPPYSIRVFLHSGQPEQKELSGELLALDRENDLAVVRVRGNNLPDPLPICPSAELYDSQRLMVMGFPLGSMLAMGASYGLAEQDRSLTQVKLRSAAVSSRMTYASGGVKLVGIEGGADPGNSGGAVLDTAGNVRSILVAGIPGTTLRYTIPSEYAVYLLRGRMLSVNPGQCFRSGSGVKQPLTAVIADPMRRITKVQLSVWAGDRGEGVRPAGDRQPSPLPGDSAVSTVQFNYEPSLAVFKGQAMLVAGECDLPEKKDGQVYWLQPRYERTDGSVQWGEAVVGSFSGLPVEQKPALLAVKHEPGSQRWVDIQSKFGAVFVPEGYPLGVEAQSIKVGLNERTRGVDADGNASVQYVYNDFGYGDDEINQFYKEILRDLFSAAKDMAIEATLTKRGAIKSHKPNMTNVPTEMRGAVISFNYQIMQSLEALGLMLPDKDINAGDGWAEEIRATFRLNKDQTEEAVSNLMFKYLGSRVRNGREEGVITFVGITRKADGGAATAGESGSSGIPFDEHAERRRGIYGLVRGAALVDLKTGYTSVAHSNSNIAIDLKIKTKDRDGKDIEVPVTYGAEQETVLQRRFAKDGPKVESAELLLPNVTVSLNPFVGKPDPNLAAGPTAGGADSPDEAAAATGTAPLQLKKEVLDKIKAAGCLIHVMRDDGGGDGSGWLAEPGIVVTNAHVVGMLDRAARPPTSVEVFFDFGLPTQKKFDAKILTVDYDQDLCVLELPTKTGLPEPMPIVPSTDSANRLYEGQQLYVVGFPLGTRMTDLVSSAGRYDTLKTQIKIRTTTVNGRQENTKTKFLKYIMVEGGLTPGNSGGAIVDANGAVRCVAVAIMPGTQIGFAVPSEYAERLLRGFPMETKPTADSPQPIAYKDGSVAKQPVEIKFGDPLKRVKKVSVDYWVGEPDKPMRASATQPVQRPGDGPRQTTACTYDAEKSLATGEFVLPDVAAGQSYWIQPRFTDGSGVERWGEAVVYAPDGPPLERREVKLEAGFKRGATRLVDVRTDADYRYVYFGTDYGTRNQLFVSLNETVSHFDAVAKGWVLVYQFQDLKFGLPRTRSELIKAIFAIISSPDLLQTVKSLQSAVIATKEGVMTNKVIADFSGLTNPLQRELFTEFNTQVLQSVQTMSVRFPNKVVQVGESWEHPTNLLISTRNRSEPALFNMKMTYLGVREAGGKLQAVLEVKGSVREDPDAKTKERPQLKTEQPGDDKDKDDAKGDDKSKEQSAPGRLVMQAPDLPPAKEVAKKPVYGHVKGVVYIDVETGVVQFCKLFLDIDAEVKHKDLQTGAEVPVRAGGTVDMELRRRI